MSKGTDKRKKGQTLYQMITNRLIERVLHGTTILRWALERSGGAAFLITPELRNIAQNSFHAFGIIMWNFYFTPDFGVPELGEFRS